MGWYQKGIERKREEGQPWIAQEASDVDGQRVERNGRLKILKGRAKQMTKSTDTASTDPKLHAQAASFRTGALPVDGPKFDPATILREEYERLATAEAKAEVSFDNVLEKLRAGMGTEMNGAPVAALLEEEFRHLARCMVYAINQTMWDRRSKECQTRASHEHQAWTLAVKDRLGRSIDNLIVDPIHGVMREYKAEPHPLLQLLEALTKR